MSHDILNNFCFKWTMWASNTSTPCTSERCPRRNYGILST